MSSTRAGRREPARSIQSFSSSIADKSSATTVKQTTSRPSTLARRLLFPQLSPNVGIPPLLTTSSSSPELDAELYDFIAIALRAYVNPWWTKITRYDKEFLPQITVVLTHVLRVFETRLTTTDLSPLVFLDLPAILTQHIVDYRNAQSKLHTSYASGGAASLKQLFHQMQPHMAVSSDGKVDEAYIRQAVDHVLKACMPHEDYDPESERYIIREIVVKVLIGGVIPRVTQPWFIHKTILDLMGPEKPISDGNEMLGTIDEAEFAINRPLLQRRRSFNVSFQALAIFFLSAIRSISGFCLALLHAYRQTVGTIKKVNQTPPTFVSKPQVSVTENVVASESDDDTVSLKSTLPGTLSEGRESPDLQSKVSTSTTSTSSQRSNVASSQAISPQLPNYTHGFLQLFSILISPPLPTPSSTQDTHLARSISLAATHILSLVATLLSPFLSRLLPYLLYTHILSSSSVSKLVLSARRALFPDGWPAPPPIDPTPEEQAELRKTLTRRLEGYIPTPLAPLFGPTSTSRSYTISCMLDPFSSQACNAHLLVYILDLVVVTLFPELGVSEHIGPAPESNTVAESPATNTPKRSDEV
ncbi:PXA domain-containing protein [Abortiporus biennis]|nr:PXA domain-containing protein [Abortiporus biennis]